MIPLRTPTCIRRIAPLLCALLPLLPASPGYAVGQSDPTDLAPFGTLSTSFVSGNQSLGAITQGIRPRNSADDIHGAYGNWPKLGTQWLECAWNQPVSIVESSVFWWKDGRGIGIPKSSRLLYWNGKEFLPVPDAKGNGVEKDRLNVTLFPEVTTTRLRLEFESDGKLSTGILCWEIKDSGKSPAFPPKVEAGGDRVTVLPAVTHLHGKVRGKHEGVSWSKESGPGEVTFADPASPDTTATFSKAGDYVLRWTARNGGETGSASFTVRVESPVTVQPLRPLAMRPWSVSGTFWTQRLKQEIVHWIPHCIAKLEEPGLKEGGIGNFVEAGKKNAGKPHGFHVSSPWTDAYTLNTVEAMCLALMLDAGGDAEIVKAQEGIRATLEKWIPIILSAQEPDGYLQTYVTLGHDGKPHPGRWTVIGDHEGYVGGYLIEAAIAHYRLTGGEDRRLYDAALRLAECWNANVGPSSGKKWHDGHEEMELALQRLAELAEEADGPGKGAKYAALSRALLDNRGGGGSTYDQTHLPVTEQTEAFGHAVRAAYLYTAMAGVAATGDSAYQGAVKSLWDNLVHRKLYLTGGIGSGETSEGFGKDYSLPNTAYSESCSDCGLLFFNHRMNLVWREARYANLMEETLCNAILGSVDLDANNFTYTNPLDQDEARYPWHVCPCCIGNIPRTLLELPVWTYAKDDGNLFVNLYAGGTVDAGSVAGTTLRLEQRTDYPWKERVEIILHPAGPATFALHLRQPDHEVSRLYRAEPATAPIGTIRVNGEPVTAVNKEGYAVITREWKEGDSVTFDVPLAIQRVTADEKVAADRGLVALRYGPMVYNFESVDQKLDKELSPSAPLEATWNPGLLGGVMTITGKFTDGTPFTAIPNYARNNRGGRSVVWIKQGK